MRRITETCTPRPDVLAGELSDQHFAAQLDAVVRRPDDYPVYGDADAFFALTYPTSGMRELLRRVFGRFAGTPDGSSGVVRVQTNFGGGKTHSLILIHHLAQGARPSNVGEFIDPALLPERARSVSLVGDVLDPVNGTATPDGGRAVTLWGALAAQLGSDAWAKMARSDETRTPPGSDLLREVLTGTPTVVMLDEIAAHLRRVYDSGDPDVRRMAGQVPAFLKSLFELAMADRNLVVVVSLATSTDAFAEETARVQREVDSVVGRQHGMVQPAADVEIAEIIKRRLFSHVDPQAADEAAVAYRDMYDQFAAREEHLSGATTNPEGYAQAVRASYPLHPELVRVMDERLATIPTFQRTRGALRLLARSVRVLWSDGDAPPVLNVGDVPLSDDDVLRQVTVKLDREEFQLVANADLVGADAHAVEVDAKRNPQARHASRAATVAFVHSLERTNVVGATRADVVLGAARPGDDPSSLVDALNDTAAVGWHLEAGSDRWRFTPEPNEKKILAEETAALMPGGRPGGKVQEATDELVVALFSPPADAVARQMVVRDVFPPSGLRAVKDEERLHLVVVHPDTLTVDDQQPLPPDGLLVEARDYFNDRRRNNRNGIVFVVADQGALRSMYEKVARLLAAKRLSQDESRFPGEANRRLREKIQTEADRADLQASIAAASCFSHVYWPVSDKTNGHLAHRQLAAAQKGDVARSATDRVWELLVANDLLMTGPVAASWLRQKGWVNRQPQIATSDVKAHLWRDHGAKLVPSDGQLTKAIQQGAESGEWVYFDARTGSFLADEPRGTAVPVIDDATFLVERDHAEAQGYIAPPVTTAMLVEVLPAPDGDTPGEPQALANALLAVEEVRGGHMPTRNDLRDVVKSAVRSGKVVAFRDGSEEPLVPSDLDDVAFDRVTLQRPAERVVVSRKNLFSGQGTVGQALSKAFGQAADLIAENEEYAGVMQVTVAVDLDEAGNRARAALTIPSMAQTLPLSVAVEINAELRGGVGKATAEMTATKATLAQTKPLAERLVADAAKCSGRVRFNVEFDQPVQLDAQPLTALREALTVAFQDVPARVNGKVG